MKYIIIQNRKKKIHVSDTMRGPRARLPNGYLKIDKQRKNRSRCNGRQRSIENFEHPPPPNAGGGDKEQWGTYSLKIIECGRIALYLLLSTTPSTRANMPRRKRSELAPRGVSHINSVLVQTYN